MTAPDYNPNEIEFLISRDIDGDLSADERRLLRQRMSESPALRDEAARLQSVARIVSHWGEAQPGVDWTAHAKLVQAKLTEPADAADEQLDQMLRGWASDRPAVDEAALVTHVMSQIGVREGILARADGSCRRRRVLYPLLRIGVPLAAAAALVFSVSTFLWNAPQASNAISVVTIERSTAVSAAKGRALVSFARNSQSVAAGAEDASITFLTLGAAPASPIGESAPL